jgi:hypothetical protein
MNYINKFKFKVVKESITSKQLFVKERGFDLQHSREIYGNIY